MFGVVRAIGDTVGHNAQDMPEWEDLFDASPFGTLVFTSDLTLLACNAAHTRSSGVPSAHLKGRYMFDVWPKNPNETGPDTEETIRASVARVMTTLRPDEPPIQKHDLPRPDGSFEPRYWRIMHSPVMRDGRVTAIRQDCWDVTASVLEAERQTALQRVAGTLAGVAFWEFDPSTDRVTCTPEMDVLFGFPTEDLTGDGRRFSTYFARIHEDDAPSIETAISELMAEGLGAVRQLEFRVIRPDGEVRQGLVRGEVVDGSERRPVITGITLDMTDLHAKEERLAALLDEKETLLGEVNHRVKNSLQLVGAILSLEARRASESQAARLRSAVSRVQSVAAVHSSLYHGRNVHSVEMGAHLRQFCAHLAESLGAAARGIALSVDANEVPLPAAKAVPVSLIVNELVTNAFKYAFPEEAPEGASVSVTLESDAEGTYALTVADNGGEVGTAGGLDDSSDKDGSTEPEQTTGSGLGGHLIATLGRQIGGHIVQERNGGWITRIEFGA